MLDLAVVGPRVYPELSEAVISHAGRTSIRVSAVTLSLTSVFEEIHANPHDLCDI